MNADDAFKILGEAAEKKKKKPRYSKTCQMLISVLR